MSKKGATSSSQEDKREGLKESSSSASSKVKSLSQLFNAYQKKTMELLSERPHEANKITLVQAIKQRHVFNAKEFEDALKAKNFDEVLLKGKLNESDEDLKAKLKEFYVALKAKELDEVSLKAKLKEFYEAFKAKEFDDALEAQALNLSKYATLNESHENSQALIENFLKIIKGKLKDPILTPDNVKKTLQLLKSQLEQLPKDRSLMRELTIRLELKRKELATVKAQAEKDAAEKAKKPSEATAPNAGSAPAAKQPAVPALTPVEATEAALTVVEKSLEDVKLLISQNSVVKFQLEGAYGAFLNFALGINPLARPPKSNPIKGESTSILQAITYELQFGKQKVASTPDQVKALLTEKEDDTALANKAAADALWKPIKDGRAKRLEEVEKKGGIFAGIQARVADWNQSMPKALRTEEMAVRDAMTPYKEGETKETRQERERYVSGYEPRTQQIREKAVAVKLATRKADRMKTEKDLHEADGRAEFEDLGMKLIPKGKRSFYGLLGADSYRTSFEVQDPTDPDYKRVARNSLDPVTLDGLPERKPEDREKLPETRYAPFPDRKKQQATALTPALQRHLQLGANNGLLVGKKEKPDDKYWEAKPQEPLPSDSMTELVAGLGKMTLGK